MITFERIRKWIRDETQFWLWIIKVSGVWGAFLLFIHKPNPHDITPEIREMLDKLYELCDQKIKLLEDIEHDSQKRISYVHMD